MKSASAKVETFASARRRGTTAIAAVQRDASDSARQKFQLSLLGSFQLFGPKGPITLGSKKLCGLMALLACAGVAPYSREKLINLLWGSHFEAQARQNLRQALARLRRMLGDDVFVSQDDLISLQGEVVGNDVERFETLIGDGSRQALAEASNLYRDTFLADVSIKEEAWSDWLLGQRRRLESLAVDGLVRLGEEELREGSAERALDAGHRAVALDSLREDAHRVIIKSLAAIGRRPEALRQYDQLSALLKRELGVEPDASTKALAKDLRLPSVQWLTNEAKPGSPRSLVAPANLPSVAVLPFRNRAPDPAGTYFGDGMVEDIIVSLASLRELFVISRSSTLSFRSDDLDARDIGRALGVRYVVSGSFQQSGKRLRVYVELSDADTGRNIWAQRLESNRGDLFQVQDDIVEGIVGSVAPHVHESELKRALRKRPEDFTAYDLTLQALDIIMQLDRSTFGRARELLQKAIAADEGFAMPCAWGARWHSLLIGQGWSTNREADSSEALRLAGRAIELDRGNALALATNAHLKSYLLHDYEAGLEGFEKALTVCPNHSLAWLLSAGTLSYIGDTKKAVSNGERGLRLSPFDRGLFYYYMFLMLSHYANGDYAEAMKWGRLSMNENPTYTATHRLFAASLVASGRTPEAQDVVHALLRLEPDFTLAAYARTRQPFREPKLRERFLDHLRRAGFPEG